MALEDLTGPSKYLAALVRTNPTADDFGDEGDDHIRGLKNVLLNTFGALTGPAPATSPASALFLNGVIGSVIWTPAADNGPGWLKADGGNIAAGAYPLLRAWVEANGLSVTIAAYNAGRQGYYCYTGDVVGAGMFLPDLRGYFVRTVGGGTVDVGRASGSVQQSQNKKHSHTITDPGHTHPAERATTLGNAISAGSAFDVSPTTATGSAVTGITIDQDPASPVGDDEARPRNIAYYAYIFAGPAS